MLWNLTNASAEFGVNRETIRRGLIKLGLETGTGEHKEYSTRDIFHAIAGDLKQEKARLTAAQADGEEIKTQVARKEVIKRDEVANYIVNTFAPVREQIVQWPSRLAAQLNPSDPAHAREVMQRECDNFLKYLREYKPTFEETK